MNLQDLREVLEKKVYYVCFTDYDVMIGNKEVAFKKEQITNTFGEFLACKIILHRQELLRQKNMLM